MTGSPARILVVEDNRRLAQGLQANLEMEGYQVDLAEDGVQGLTRAREDGPDLVILDLMLPEMDGFEVLARLRNEGNDVPVLILSARSEEVDKVRGFRSGADDFVTKPFSLMELLARVEAMLRRIPAASSPQAEVHEMESFGDVLVDVSARSVERAGRPVHLSPKAFDLLVALLRRRGRVATRIELMKDVWGHLAAVQSRTVDAHVAELRRKLEEDASAPRHILTVWKAGYRLRA